MLKQIDLMKNYLVITLGTREIQLLKGKIDGSDFDLVDNNSTLQHRHRPELKLSVRSSWEFPDYFTIIPRTDGETIKNNYKVFEPLLDFPLIDPVLKHLKEKQIYIILLVYTDQENVKEIKPENRNNDTVHFAEILTKFIRKDQGFSTTKIYHFGVFEKVTDIGFQYDDFAKINEDLPYSEHVETVYLFPQGGIDAINQALTLRLIEVFKSKLKQLQKAEHAEVREMDFPAKFINMLNKQAIRKHLNDYQFNFIDENLTSDTVILNLSKEATNRLQLKYDKVSINVENEDKIKDLYIAAKIALLKQNNPVEFMWRLFTINELMFKTELEKILPNTRNYYDSNLGKSDSNIKWENALNTIDNNIIPYLRKKKVATNNPNRWAFRVICHYLHKNRLIVGSHIEKRIFVSNLIESLSEIRNSSQHDLGSASIDTINEILNKKQLNYSIYNLIGDLDQIFDIQNFGIYDKIKAEIENWLDS